MRIDRPFLEYVAGRANELDAFSTSQTKERYGAIMAKVLSDLLESSGEDVGYDESFREQYSKIYTLFGPEYEAQI
tara:strand:+ start:214 stop:438 length:225 start_codon:yes stop_codon:yes gene_type:complete